MVLDDTTKTATEILAGQYDYVIVTYQYVMSRHRSHLEAHAFFDAIDELGYHHVMNSLRDKDKPRTDARANNASYSILYQELHLPFRPVILDEGHLAQKLRGANHNAIKALYKSRLVILSGTFVSNRWSDLCGIFDLFPQSHPFNTTQRFNKAFANITQNGRYIEPTKFEAQPPRQISYGLCTGQATFGYEHDRQERELP